jgi:prephenate dehydrogenase
VKGVQCVAVVGLGLIGGSLARDLVAQGLRVLGFDRDADMLRAAADEVGIIPAGVEFERVAEADVVVLAVPVATAAALLARLGPYLSRTRLVTDVGSTKRGVVAAAEAAGIDRVFVGSHPLAGSHASGWSASHPTFFDGARVYLCRSLDTEPQAESLAEELWASVGALPEWVEAATHDHHLARTSHLPQTIATALALALDDHGVARGDLGPGGREMTRLAGSSAEMWTEILLENADALLPALAGFADATATLQAAIHAGDRDAIARLFGQAKRWTTPLASP